MADLQPSYHGSEQLQGIIDTDLYLFFALLQASSVGHLGKNKAVFHKGILREFLFKCPLYCFVIGSSTNR